MMRFALSRVINVAAGSCRVEGVDYNEPDLEVGDTESFYRLTLSERNRPTAASHHLEILIAMPGDKGLSPTLKAVPNCDIS